MDKYTFSQKNDLVVKHKSKKHFGKDLELFQKHCSYKHSMMNDLARANEFSFERLDGQMLYILLDKISIDEILKNREEILVEIIAANPEPVVVVSLNPEPIIADPETTKEEQPTITDPEIIQEEHSVITDPETTEEEQSVVSDPDSTQEEQSLELGISTDSKKKVNTKSSPE